MKKKTKVYSWLGEGVEALSPAERRQKIRELEEERARINADLAEAVELYAKESGNSALRLRPAELNPFLLDNSDIGTDEFDEKRITGYVYAKGK